MQKEEFANKIDLSPDDVVSVCSSDPLDPPAIWISRSFYNSVSRCAPCLSFLLQTAYIVILRKFACYRPHPTPSRHR